MSKIIANAGVTIRKACMHGRPGYIIRAPDGSEVGVWTKESALKMRDIWAGAIQRAVYARDVLKEYNTLLDRDPAPPASKACKNVNRSWRAGGVSRSHTR